MVTGTTIIDHRIRAELNLSLQEYTIMDFCEKNVGKNLPEHCIQEIAVEWGSIAGTFAGLLEKGFVEGYVPTKKWTEAFKKPKKVDKKGFTAPTIQEVIEFFKSKGYNEIGAKKAFEYYSVADWTDGRGNQVKNWKQKMLANWLKDEYKQTNQSTGITLETRIYNK